MNVKEPIWLTNTQGLHRFYLADSGATSCVEFDRYVAKNNGYFYANITLPKSKCVGVSQLRPSQHNTTLHLQKMKASSRDL
jgi:hypothetical protein